MSFTHQFDATMLREYDIRGIVGKTLNPSDAFAIGRCFGSIVMRAGGRVCERKFFNKTGVDLPTSFGFARDRALEELLNERDGAFFYSFVVAIRAGG